MGDWPNYIIVFLTPLIGVITVYIAYQQWKTNCSNQQTNSKRLKHELYDKRFAIYNATRIFLRDIVVKNSVSDEMLIKYWSGINPAHFLLDNDLATYLEEIEQKAIDLQTIQIEAQDFGKSSIQALERGELKKWFYKQISILNKIFLPYLNLEH